MAFLPRAKELLLAIPLLKAGNIARASIQRRLMPGIVDLDVRKRRGEPIVAGIDLRK